MTSSTSRGRRNVLRALGALPALGVAGVTGFAATSSRMACAAAPQYVFKYGNNLPVSHPLNVRAQEVAARIASESKGRMELRIFPNNQLGGDTDMLAQVRNGGIDIFNAGTMVIATLAPISAITAVGFAFSSYDQVWHAVDGKLGDSIREAFAKTGLHTFEKMWDNGFRQITSGNKPIASASDLTGMKIRVPVSPMGISLFKSLQASPTSLQFSEVYSALQTRVVDAQENPLAIVQTAKLYEVQKFCSITNHSWDGYHLVVNGRAWRALPDDLKVIVARAFNEAAIQQREDVYKLNTGLQSELASKGLAFNTASPQSFRAQLQKSGYYAEWQKKFGAQAWSLLEATAGKVA
ncbi:TRAP transporter substrate-binding protein [Pandoraea pulmonicola]|uniref:ABC transporter substrate-binding protein n=1 Tax=Pandoraea pulmonicola TaxID=93221 RepID=A0AAJ5CZZ4_PANPU|nr:TRAP transporter substrate-binding protein [Pandoraea pulmonicola]AJC21304.1 ABC transporter substrate-binding protein [Pandoraea pulmonicola]SUA89990.1 Extracytoplasmic solute receptor protein yiaO [Pandoraea pulmonicola]